MCPDQIENPDEKNSLCKAILAESLSLPPEYYGLIIDTLMRIPITALEKIVGLLDRVVLIRSNTYGGVEKVSIVCRVRHKMNPINESLHIKRKGEPDTKPKRIPEPVSHEKWIIFLVEDNLKSLSKTQKISVIAEELAHVYLKHDR